MGGDRGVGSIIGGINRSLTGNNKIKFLIHGDEITLTEAIKNYPQVAEACTIIPCETVVAMDENRPLRCGLEKNPVCGAL